MRYAALLRGVNVGTGPRVPMAELAALLGRLGMADVMTYLNSGNVLFGSALGAPELGRLLEAELEAAFGAFIPTLVKTGDEMIAIAAAIPAGWSNDAEEQTYVAYLFSDVDHPDLLDELPVKRQFMDIFYTPGAIVWHIRRADYNRSRITGIVGHRAYARMTTRNVNTARKLAALCAGA